MNLEQLINNELERLHALLKSSNNPDPAFTLAAIKKYNEQLLKLLAGETKNEPKT